MNLLDKIRTPEPIWIDATGKQYYYLYEIEDTHMRNIIKYIRSTIIPNILKSRSQVEEWIDLPESSIFDFEMHNEAIEKANETIILFTQELRQREEQGWSF